jgi:hypothetical protein
MMVGWLVGSVILKLHQLLRLDSFELILYDNRE